jgi:hypothetical protein
MHLDGRQNTEFHSPYIRKACVKAQCSDPGRLYIINHIHPLPQGTNRVLTAWDHIVRPRNGVVGYRDDRSIVLPTIFGILKALSSTQGLDFLFSFALNDPLQVLRVCVVLIFFFGGCYLSAIDNVKDV